MTGNPPGTGRIDERFRLADWLVMPAENLLLRDGKRVALEPKVMQLLTYFAEHSEQVISAEQLLIDLWRGTFYGDNPVHKSIAVLRKALGDDASAPRYLQTIRRKGYRLIAAVSFPDGYDGAIQTAEPRWTEGNPYRGLQRFERHHAAVFCGRSRATAGLLRVVREQFHADGGLVLVVGPSGSGKSSLVRAGVLPMLIQPGGFDGLQAPCVAVIEPGSGALIPALATQLIQWTHRDWPLYIAAEREALIARLRDTPASVVARITEMLDRIDLDQRDVVRSVALLVIDPLEALLSGPGDETDADRDALLRFLQLACRSGRCIAIAPCRSDRYARLADLPVLAELKQGGGHFDLFPPSPGDIGDMIRLPARAAGLSFGRDPESQARLDDVLRDAAVHQPDALPLLQYVLAQLFEARSEQGELGFGAYQALGGLEGALAQHAENVLDKLPPPVRDSLPGLLQRMLVIDADGDVSGRSIELASLTEGARILTAAFVDARLFVSRQRADGEASVTAVHDALWRRWPRVTAWVEANQSTLHARARLAAQAQRWAEAGKPPDLLLARGLPLEEAKALVRDEALQLQAMQYQLVAASVGRQRRTRRIQFATIAAIVTLGVASGISGLYAWQARRTAELQRASAEGLVSFMLGDLTARLKPLGKLDVLDSIGAATLSYLDRLSNDGGDRISQLHRATALAQVADIEATRGDLDTAESVYHRALALIEGLSGRYPENPDVLYQQGQIEFGYGYLEFRRGANIEARRHWQGYMDAARALVDREPENLQWQRELAYAQTNIGVVEEALDDLPAAQSAWTSSVQLKRALIRAIPHDTSLQHDLANTLNAQGRIAERLGHLTTALDAYREAMTMMTSHPSSQPDNADYQERLAAALSNLASIQVDLGLGGEAQENLKRAEKIYVDLRQIDDSNATWRRQLAYVYRQQSSLSRARNTGDALDFARRSIAVIEPLAAKQDIPQADLIALGSSYRETAEAALERGDLALALQNSDRALQYFVSMGSSTSGSIALANALRVRADLAAAHFDKRRAMALREEGIRTLEEVPINGRHGVSYLVTLAQLLTAMNCSDEAERVTDELKGTGYRGPCRCFGTGG